MIVFNTGASFIGLTVITIVCVVVANPSFTVSVIVSLPLKFVLGTYVIIFPLTVTVPFNAVAVDTKVSLFKSSALKLIKSVLSSSTF